MKCKLKKCLENTKGQCDIFIPTMIKRRKLDSTSCPYYSTDFQADFKWLRSKGGLLNIIMAESGKRTETELKSIKKAKRKKK